jgi:DUF4097 and DUF4098 domain-containing protein YvlB
MQRTGYVVLGLTVLAVALSGCVGVPGLETTEEFNRTVTVEDTGGVLKLQTSNGPISADILDFRGDAAITTSNGAVMLRLARDLDVQMVATTSNGRIAASDLPLMFSESSGTRIAGTLGSGGPTIAVTTSNGNIDLSGL